MRLNTVRHLEPVGLQVPRTAPRKPTFLESSLSLVFRLLPVKHGAHRLLDRLVPHAWSKEASIVDVPYRGHTLQIDVSDLVGWHFLVMRSFDPEITEVLRRFANPDGEDVFWDVGANKGVLCYTVAAALPHCKVVAIEPQSGMTRLLKDNLETVAPGRHEVFAVGIGERPGSFELVIPPGNLGHGSLLAAKEADSILEKVEVVTAEAIRRRSRFGWPSILKIDVEGYEPAVIRSMQAAFTSRTIRCCAFECHATETRGFEQIRAATEPSGYRAHAITKTPLSTRLIPTTALVRRATDYALIRDDLSEGV
jgi:FkbM family methyltransferase